ncbi:MAG: formate dehydrogenase accessory sulfurtransferase FdhD [Acidimicrobiales bacterium]
MPARGTPSGSRPAALLLTGGASRRMGRDKARLVVDGDFLAQRTAALLLGAADPVVEVGPGFTALPAVREDPAGSGPLAALAAGGAALRHRGHAGPVLVVATDLPNLTAGFLQRLADCPVPTAEHSVVPRDGSGRAQPVCARYSAAAVVRAQELVAAGELSFMALLSAVPVTWLDADAATEKALFDVDTPADLANIAPDSARDLATIGSPHPSSPSSPSVPRIASTIRRASTPVRVIAVRVDHHLEMPDEVATEEPMEIRAGGPGQQPRSVAVTMRTPGHDFELAVGFLFTEGIVRSRHDVAAVRYCDLPEGGEQRLNIVTVDLTRPLADNRGTRSFAVNASCGICGKASLDEVQTACGVVAAGTAHFPIPWSQIVELPDRLRADQPLFDRTGGLHGAAVHGPDGELVVREDVGRHNAVDKLVGHALLAGRVPLRDEVLVVSGRVSFEIVQKAAMAGLPMIVAVSAPSSLAVQAAERLGVTLAAFVRGQRFNIYSHPERIDLSR